MRYVIKVTVSESNGQVSKMKKIRGKRIKDTGAEGPLYAGIKIRN